ncbi:MAG: hypothetical protein RDV41_15095, partial [Planctomycetota bacterium]|nr:hypothetical protein [Planctomycetota bacterium]
MFSSPVDRTVSILERAPYLIMALLFVCIGQAGCGEKENAPAATEDGSTLVAPKGLTAFDTPNDQGGSISLTWDVWNIPTAGKDSVQYVVYIADSPEGEFQEAARFKATTSFMSDEEGYFGFSESNRNRHWVAVRPEDFFPPASQVESDKVGEEIAAVERELENCRAIDLSNELDGVLAEWDSLLRNSTE